MARIGRRSFFATLMAPLVARFPRVKASNGATYSDKLMQDVAAEVDADAMALMSKTNAVAWREGGHTFYSMNFSPDCFALEYPRIGTDV
jgi:hypothetical protein